MAIEFFKYWYSRTFTFIARRISFDLCRICDQLRCTDCDFQVTSFANLAWDNSVDYLFLRNNYPDASRLKAKLRTKPGKIVAFKAFREIFFVQEYHITMLLSLNCLLVTVISLKIITFVIVLMQNQQSINHNFGAD